MLGSDSLIHDPAVEPTFVQMQAGCYHAGRHGCEAVEVELARDHGHPERPGSPRLFWPHERHPISASANRLTPARLIRARSTAEDRPAGGADPAPDAGRIAQSVRGSTRIPH